MSLICFPSLLGGNSWLFSEGTGRRDVGDSLICPLLSAYIHSCILKDRNTRPKSWGGNAVEEIFLQIGEYQEEGKYELQKAQDTPWVKFCQGWRNGRNKEVKVMERSQHWKGWGPARGMAYLLTHIKTSLKAKRETSTQTNTVMRNLLLMIPQAVVVLSGSLK